MWLMCEDTKNMPAQNPQKNNTVYQKINKKWKNREKFNHRPKSQETGEWKGNLLSLWHSLQKIEIDGKDF